jgi:hypothetical protein
MQEHSIYTEACDMNEIIYDVQTGVETIVELSAKEVEKREAEAAKAEQDLAALKAQKAADKAALLEKLGITESEAKLLLS